MRILISRTDSIGDSVLTLPLCGYLKQVLDCEIVYYGKNYVRPVVELSKHIDDFLEYENDPERIRSALFSAKADVIIHVFPRREIARAAKRIGIKTRIGTSGRIFHLGRCNKLIRFTRKHSDLHESQLNFKLLKGLGINFIPTLDEIPELYGVGQVARGEGIILHPGSRGSAVDYPLEYYAYIAKQLCEKGEKVFLTGTEEEGRFFRTAFQSHPNLIDTSGQKSLHELIDLIKSSEALVACSTGPLHIAAMHGVKTIGLFVDIRPIHPGRWGAIGQNAINLVPVSSESRDSIADIQPDQVLNLLLNNA